MDTDKYVLIVRGGYWNDEKQTPVAKETEATIYTNETVHKKRRKLIKKFPTLYIKIIH